MPDLARPLRLAVAALAFLAAAAVAPPCIAAPDPAELPEDLQRELKTCAEIEFARPDVWTAEDHGLACMTGKRQAFSPRCQIIYDKVSHALHLARHYLSLPQRP